MDEFGEQNRIITIFNWRTRKMKKKIGWVCPKCDRVYAPHIPECYHCNKEKAND